MIKLDAFLQGIRANCSRITHYQLGGDGSGGGCDCIGLIIGAVRLAGGTWTGTHGSNYAARSEIRDLHLITKGEYFLGEIVFKARAPGDSGYDLPDKYKTSGDLLDYYHVGVVTCIDPFCITHCTSVPGGIKEDNQPGKWLYGGELKMVEYGGEPMEVLYEAMVTAVSGRTVNMRKSPSEKADVIKSIPVGSIVEVLGDSGANWSQIQYNGLTGWMMSKFLVKQEPVDFREELEEALKAISRAQAIVSELLGGGVG